MKEPDVKKINDNIEQTMDKIEKTKEVSEIKIDGIYKTTFTYKISPLTFTDIAYYINNDNDFKYIPNTIDPEIYYRNNIF